MSIKPFQYAGNTQTNNPPLDVPVKSPSDSGRIKMFQYEPQTVTADVKPAPVIPAPKVQDTSRFSSFLNDYKKIAVSAVSDFATTVSGMASIPRDVAVYGTKAVKGISNTFADTQAKGEQGVKEFYGTAPKTAPIAQGENSQFYQDIIDELGKGKLDESNWDAKLQKKVKDYTEQLQISRGVDPNSRTFAQNLGGGFGSMAGFFVPSTVIARSASLLAKTENAIKVYSRVGQGTMTATEALMEGDQVFKDVYDQTGDVQEAQKKADQTVGINIALLGITNKFSKYFDQTATGFYNTAKGALTSFVSEGTQEGLQTLTSNIQTGRPMFEGVKDAVLIGGIVGSMTHIASRSVVPEERESINKAKEQIFSENKGNPIVDEYAENDKILTDTLDYIQSTKEIETPEQVKQALIDGGMDENTATQMIQESVLRDIQQSVVPVTPESIQSEIDAFMGVTKDIKTEAQAITKEAELFDSQNKEATYSAKDKATLAEKMVGGKDKYDALVQSLGDNTAVKETFTKAGFFNANVSPEQFVENIKKEAKVSSFFAKKTEKTSPHEYEEGTVGYKAQQKDVAKSLKEGKKPGEVSKNLQKYLKVSQEYADKLVKQQTETKTVEGINRDQKETLTPEQVAPLADKAKTAYWDNVIQPSIEKGEAVIIGADDLKDYFGKDYNDKNHPIYSRAAFLLYERALDENTDGTVVLTGGGPASGKTELIVKSLLRQGYKGVIYDSNMSNYDGAVKQINMAREKGKSVEINGVIPNLDKARTFSLKRENETGRGISDSTFARGHAGFPNVVIKLLENKIVDEKDVHILDTRNITTKEDVENLAENEGYIASVLDTLKTLDYNEDTLSKTYAKENYNKVTGKRKNGRTVQEGLNLASTEDRANLSDARIYALDNIQYYFDVDTAPQIVNYINNEGEQIAYRTKTTMADFPEHLRERDLFNRVKPYWILQKRPTKGVRMQELYDILQKYAGEIEKNYKPSVEPINTLPDGTTFKEVGTTEQVLIAHHNLTESNLLHADKLGGLPVPSIAISNYRLANDNFGEITLIGDKNLIDPKIKSNKVFNTDSYSRRYPTIDYYVENKQALDTKFAIVKEYFNDKELIRSYESGYYLLSENVKDNGIAAFERSMGIKALFAIEKGISKDATRNDIDEVVSKNRAEFEKFANGIASGIEIQSSIFNGYTASGRRKNIPETLENLVKVMKGSGRTDENFNYGVGSLRSAVAKKFKNISEIQKDKDQLISDEEMQKIKDDTSKQFSDLMDKHGVVSYFSFADNIVDYELGKITASQLKEYTGISDEAVKEFEDFGKYLAALPSEYFEVKMQRAVGLNEFNVAIVPDTISEEAEQILIDNGIIIHKFNKEQNNRNEVIQEAVKDNAILFKEKTNIDIARDIDRAMVEDSLPNPEILVLDDFKKRYKVDFNVLAVRAILTGKQSIYDPRVMGKAYGAASGDTIAIAEDAIKKTGRHELVHFTLENLDLIPEFKGFDKESILMEQAKKMGVELTDKNIVEVEEQLALDIEQYENGSYKPKNSLLQRFFEFIKETLRGFRNIVEASNGAVIESFYDAILYGSSNRKNYIQVKKLGEINKYLINNIIDFSPKYKSRIITLSNGFTSMKLKEADSKDQNDFTEMQNAVVEAYIETGDLTTKILKDLEGKTFVSKQYILDATNRAEIKQVEKDLIREIVSTEGDKVNVASFAEKVKSSLLPLLLSEDSINPTRNGQYENIALPDEKRGDVKDYFEKIYQSPIETSAGEIHFPYAEDAKNYFGHTRVEDMADNSTRRVIEVQSDLYQKGRLEGEVRKADVTNAFDRAARQARKDEVAKLAQYNDPTAHFRMIREEIKKAAEDGKTKLQFPTGATAVEIEGLGDSSLWVARSNPEARIVPKDLEVGKVITESRNINGEEKLGIDWVVTDILEDGKFSAIHKSLLDYERNSGIFINQDISYDRMIKEMKEADILKRKTETFDISGKVDQNNPIYKFYEKEVGRYLKNNYKSETVVDDNGVTWYQVEIKPEYKGAVVAFKEKVPQSVNKENTQMMFPEFTAMSEEDLAWVKENIPEYYEIIRTTPVEKTPELPKPQQGEESVFKNALEFLGLSEEEGKGKYDKITFKDQLAKAITILKENEQLATDIALGKKKAPEGVIDTSISVVVQSKALQDRNWQLFKDIAEVRSEKQTERGQEIVLEKLRNMELDSFGKLYSDLESLQEQLVKAKFYKNWFHAFKQENKEPIKKYIRKATIKEKVPLEKRLDTVIKQTAKDLDRYLNTLAC